MKSLSRETLRMYWHHMWAYKSYTIGMLFFVPAAIVTHQILPPIIAADILDKLATDKVGAGELWKVFGLPLIMYAALIVLGGTVVWRIAIYFAWKMEMYAVQDMHQRIFIHYSKLDANFHANSFGGSLVSRANKFIGSFFRIYEPFVFQFYSLFITIAATCFVLLPRAPLVVGGLLILSSAYILITINITKKVRLQHSVVADKENKQTGYLADMVTNVMAVKSFSARSFEINRYAKITVDVRKSVNSLMRLSLTREAAFGSITTLMQVISLVLAVVSVVRYEASVGVVLLAYYYTNNVTVRLWDFAQSGLKNLNRGFGDAEEMTRTLLAQPEIKDPTNPKSLEDTGDIELISFEEITFEHDKEGLFHDFNLSIKKGETIGLVGHSGSGKTTLTSLLLRFKDIDNGSIKIMGTDIRDVLQDDLRAHISYVPQEPLLFHRSLSENIAYGKPDASMDEIIAASKRANAHEFIKDLPEGYDTLVGERGVKLSGGQRQRVAIARAMIKDAPILVLDEATSALDSESEQLIQDALWKLMDGKTAIVIAHRLSTIQKMDRIIVLDNGKIIEEGSHAKLLKKKGQYAKLWAHQSGGFLLDK